ncbi:formate transporter FocA [Paraferrimonas haliotis]|uniref:Formate transporter FocA n=1 Tax=Paraferrimonas haliotis TaxID=2013866 RepID=A0AA37TRI6_9GAMM|nr:formate transporter FocA [Paraferrimonas haliotis]GLS83007.1 hypothetical protein GCM10007894_09840 [Paraferrimonas haliotis]
MHSRPEEQSAPHSPKLMMQRAELFALNKTTKSIANTVYLAMMAGVFIGLAFVFYVTVVTGSDSSWGITRLVGGLAFSTGLILTVLCGAELFTSTVLSIIAWANKQLATNKMLKLWGLVYAGNFLGAVLLAVLIMGAGMHQLDHGQWGLSALQLAQHKIHHSFLQAFCLGVLCNLLVCLAVWLTFSTTNALSKALLVVLPVALFVSSGFEHCVANMFMVPLAIMIHSGAPDAFWLQIGVDASQFADLTWANFISANLIPVTLGNIVGGALLVGLYNWNIYSKPLPKVDLKKKVTVEKKD